METEAKSATLCAVGDVIVNRDDPQGFPFEAVQPLFNEADLVFGNCEGIYVDTLNRAPSCIVPCRSYPRSVAGLKAAGFDVMGCANNHFIDGSYSGMSETLGHLKDAGISAVGAGDNIDHARAPAVLERNGLRVGFLAYCSVFPSGYDATTTMPGIVPLRAHTLYEPPATRYYSPGEQARVLTIPFDEDVEALKKDITQLRERVDIVIASFHWGLFTEALVITDYERAYGRAAIDFGADMVIGHHHHQVRGVERYKGRVIAYGLGHFVFDQPDFAAAEHRDGVIRDIAAARAERDGAQAINPETEYPLLPFPPEGRLTVVLRCRMTPSGTEDESLVPCVIEPSGAVRPVAPTSRAGASVIDLMQASNQFNGLELSLRTGEQCTISGLQGIRIP